MADSSMGTVVTNILSPAQAQQIAADNKKRFDDMVAGRIPRHRPAPKDPVVEAEEKAYYEEFQEWERRDQYPTNWEATVMRMHQNGLLLPDDSDEDDEYAFLEEPEDDYRREMSELDSLFQMKDRLKVINPLPLHPFMDRRYYISREYTEKMLRQDAAQGRPIPPEPSGPEKWQALYREKNPNIAEKIAEGNQKRELAPQDMPPSSPRRPTLD